MHTTPLFIFQCITILLGFGTLYIILNRSLHMQQRHLIYAMFGSVMCNMGVLMTMMAGTDTQVYMHGEGFVIVGASVFIVGLLTMTAVICNIKIPSWFLASVIGADTLFVFSHLLDDRYHAFYISRQIVLSGAYPHPIKEYNYAGVLFWIVSIMIPAIGGFGILVYTYVKDKNSARRTDYMQYIIVMLILFVVQVCYLLIWDIDYAPAYPLGTYILIYLTFSKWKKQGVDVISVAAKNAINAIDSGIITLNEYKEIIYYNDAAISIIPSIEHFLSSNIELIPELEFSSFEDGDNVEMDFNDRKYIVKIRENIDGLGGLSGYSLVISDMTEMLSMMDEIREERQKADEANQAKSMFIANVSHELRTPMNAIIGMSELIIEESRGRKVYDMAVTIKKASNALLQMVNNVLDFSKLEANKMELVESEYSLYELVNDIGALLNMTAATHGISLKWSVDEELPAVVYGDEGKIRQVLINFINNGIKFTKDGYVRLDVSGQVKDDYAYLMFMVSDTGIGIMEEDISKIFGDFQQVDKVINKSVEGTGLGLSIAKSMVNLMGGSIDVDSVYGEGTTFTVRLVQKVIDARSIEEAGVGVTVDQDQLKMFEAPEISCLIVDDNKVNIMVAKGMIDNYKLQIESASSGEEALEMVQNKDYDIIMMDHMMPGMDGIETTGLIRDYYDYKAVRPYIIALTANAYGGIKDMFLEHGFDDFMSKPIDKLVMYQMLLKCIPESKRTFTGESYTPATYSEDDLAELFMEGVDVRSAVDQHGGQIENYLDLLELFYIEGRQKLPDLKNFLEAEDYKNYQILVHGIKSTSLNIGAVFVSEKAKEHEMRCKDGDYAFIRENVDSLYADYDKLLSETERVVAKKRSKTKPDENRLEALEMDELIAQIEEILSFSENFEGEEARNALGSLMRHDLPNEVEETLSEVNVKFKMYDDDGAEELLHQLRDKLAEG